MARASCIYVLQRKHDGKIMAGWTVKYEISDWISTRDESRKAVEITYQIVRCRDGYGAEYTTIVPWEEII